MPPYANRIGNMSVTRFINTLICLRFPGVPQIVNLAVLQAVYPLFFAAWTRQISPNSVVSYYRVRGLSVFIQ